MFFILPIGSDQAVYSRPYITYAIALLCVLVHIWGVMTTDRHAAEVNASARAFFEELKLDEAARIAPEAAEGLPANVRAELSQWTADDPDDPAVDEALTEAAVVFGESVGRLPFIRLGYVPADDRPLTLLSYQVVHGGWGHLIGNVLFLLVAGGVLECFWRKWAYVALFAASGVLGALLHAAVTDDPTVPLVGASGAIAGLMAGFLLGHARARVHLLVVVWLLVFFRSFRVSIVAMYLIPIWAAVQVWSLLQDSGGGVSYGAHVGGFVAGLALTFAADRAGLIARDAGYG